MTKKGIAENNIQNIIYRLLGTKSWKKIEELGRKIHGEFSIDTSSLTKGMGTILVHSADYGAFKLSYEDIHFSFQSDSKKYYLEHVPYEKIYTLYPNLFSVVKNTQKKMSFLEKKNEKILDFIGALNSDGVMEVLKMKKWSKNELKELYRFLSQDSDKINFLRSLDYEEQKSIPKRYRAFYAKKRS